MNDALSAEDMELRPQWLPFARKLGDLKVIYGPTRSGKTGELLCHLDALAAVDQLRGREKTVLLTALVPDSTHEDGMSDTILEVKRIQDVGQLVWAIVEQPGAQVVGIDNADGLGDKLEPVVHALRSLGKDVCIAGHLVNEKREIRRAMVNLLSVADEARRMTTHCRRCRIAAATFAQLIDPESANPFEPRCLFCFEPQVDDQISRLIRAQGLPDVRRTGGILEVYTGPMLAGKTRRVITIAIAAEKNSLGVIGFKHALDVERGFPADQLVSHSGLRFPAVSVHNAAEIWESIEEWTKKNAALPDIVVIDEAQFFKRELVPLCVALAQMGVRTVVSGLNLNFRGEPFGCMPMLMAYADAVDIRTAFCWCRKPATRSQRFAHTYVPASYFEKETMVGGKDLYYPSCVEHHVVPGHPMYERLSILRR